MALQSAFLAGLFGYFKTEVRLTRARIAVRQRCQWILNLNPNRLVGVLIVVAMAASTAAAFWIDAIVGLGAVAAWAMYLARLMRG